MPRKKKTIGGMNPGAPSQPLRVASGGGYGERKQLVDSQRAMPLPDNTNPTAVGHSMPQALADAAQFAAPQIGLDAPTTRPGQPVTAGLYNPTPTFGPAAPSLADTLRQAAEASGSEDLLALAERAAQMGQ